MQIVFSFFIVQLLTQLIVHCLFSFCHVPLRLTLHVLVFLSTLFCYLTIPFLPSTEYSPILSHYNPNLWSFPKVLTAVWFFQPPPFDSLLHFCSLPHPQTHRSNRHQMLSGYTLSFHCFGISNLYQIASSPQNVVHLHAPSSTYMGWNQLVAISEEIENGKIWTKMYVYEITLITQNNVQETQTALKYKAWRKGSKQIFLIKSGRFSSLKHNETQHVKPKSRWPRSFGFCASSCGHTMQAVDTAWWYWTTTN